MEQINKELGRIRNLIRVISENKEETCYPSDYTPGKKYNREVLAKIFCCFADEKKFPYEFVLEAMFPMLPPNEKIGHHHSPQIDPKHIQIGENSFVDMEEYVRRETSNKRVRLININITLDMIHEKTLNFLPHKKSAPNYRQRVDFQKNKVKKYGVDVLTDTEPFIIEYLDGKYRWDEGWHRLLALVELYDEGIIDSIKGKAFVYEKI